MGCPNIINVPTLSRIKAYPITVSHLVKIAETGAWFKPEPIT